MKATTARSVMTENVEVIDSQATVLDAAKRLTDLDIGAMPICDGERLRGMLTDRDIVTKVVSQGKDPAKVRVNELETSKPVTIGADDSIEEAMRTMADHKIRRLPVIDGHRLIGMLSQADLAKALSTEQTGELVATISSD